MKVSLKTGLVVLFTAGAIFFAAKFLYVKNNMPYVKIKNHFFEAEKVSSPSDLEKGLGGRESMREDCAMLFILPSEGNHNFHMKGMEFDLDIIWINEGKIVYIARNVSSGFKETIIPRVLADMVLEINAGLSDRYSFQEGDSVEIGR